jgi:hypothetical protein
VIRSRGEEGFSHQFFVPEGSIRFMWCHRGRLFIIYKGGKEIFMTDFAKDIPNYSADTSNELAERFALDYADSPGEWLRTLDVGVVSDSDGDRDSDGEES